MWLHTPAGAATYRTRDNVTNRDVTYVAYVDYVDYVD